MAEAKAFAGRHNSALLRHMADGPRSEWKRRLEEMPDKSRSDLTILGLDRALDQREDGAFQSRRKLNPDPPPVCGGVRGVPACE